ncbi:MAG TPA: GNAT family N-acetyltransferase [Opitutaceae bacterium]
MTVLRKAGGETAGINVRAAVAGDIALILQLIRKLAEYEKLLPDVVATEESLGKTLFPAGGSPPAAHVVIGELEGIPAGFAVYFFNYSTFLAKPGLYLEDLFVEPASRGKGLGKALLLHLARLANELGCGRMEWSVLDWNTPSIEFYKRIGAVPLDDWTIFRLAGEALRRHAT